MDIDDKNDDSGRNLMHRTNDEICIGENNKVTQHDIGFKDDDEGNNEYHIESTNPPILAVNITKKMLIFVTTKIYSRVTKGLSLALHFPHLI